ncbi:hypothetical protein BOTBODRAFT_27563 [Botryobasidium botryosum FD-172 SS1]|uniref:Uncharacterized protein n=1 Tax=Botryobasidium botryosum (strain FD-172 SS1) TaxID=930990 RepID=A0A067MZL4_BOTB1|nr:hypothetical protein BOTBODRAFT_27563 [Botryobasidium botryosum FD-172 SS1]
MASYGIFEKPAAIKEKESVKPKEADVKLIVCGSGRFFGYATCDFSISQRARDISVQSRKGSEGDPVKALKSLCSPHSI